MAFRNYAVSNGTGPKFLQESMYRSDNWNNLQANNLNNSSINNFSMTSSPVYIVQAPRLKRTYETYKVDLVNVCALIHACCGALSFSLGIANPLVCGLLGFVGYGIWAGIMFFSTGVVCWFSARKKTTSLVISALVLTNLSSCLAAIQFSLGVYSAQVDNLSNTNLKTKVCLYWVNSTSSTNTLNDLSGAVVSDSLLACVAFVEAFAAVLSSSAACMAVCGPQDFTTATDIPIRKNRVLPAQFVFTSDQSVYAIDGQPYISGTSRG